jgi:hypothetical protein
MACSNNRRITPDLESSHRPKAVEILRRNQSTRAMLVITVRLLLLKQRCVRCPPRLLLSLVAPLAGLRFVVSEQADAACN